MPAGGFSARAVRQPCFPSRGGGDARGLRANCRNIYFQRLAVTAQSLASRSLRSAVLRSGLRGVLRAMSRARTQNGCEMLDRKGLDALEQTELKRISTEQRPERQAFVDALKEHADSTKAENLSSYTYKHVDSQVRGLGIEAKEANIKVRGLLKNEESLLDNPGRALDALQRQGQALQKIESRGLADYAQLNRDFARAPDAIRQELLANKVPGWRFGAGGLSAESPLLDKAIQEQMVARFGSAEQPTLSRGLAAVMDSAGIARQRVTELRATLERLTAEPASEQLTKIRAAREALSGPTKKTLGEKLLHMLPGGDLVTTAAELGGKATAGFKAAIGKIATRTGEAVSAFAGKAALAAGKAAPLATKVLSGLSYGQAPATHAVATAGSAPSDLASLWKARTDEIKAQTAYDQAGIPRVRPEARQAIAARLQPVRVANPILGDRLETLAVRRLEYLSSLIPRRPDVGGLQTGLDRWKPSDMEMRSWARSAAAVEDPNAVEERVVHGTITPEDAAAYWAVYPERAKHFKQEVMASLPELQKSLPFTRRLSLSIFVGEPVDPSLNPRVLAMLQGQFAAEPGSAGGTQAPKAEPQFGSIKKSPDAPTPAQSRAQGAHA